MNSIYFRKLTLKKKNLNGYIPNDRANSESKLKFSESSYNFLQNNCFLLALTMSEHDRVIHPLQPSVTLPAACSSQIVNDEPGKILNLLFFAYFFLNDQKLSKNCTFWQKQYFSGGTEM